MFVIKKLLRLQVGRFNFINNESLNLIGGIGKKKEPLIPFDPDMRGAVQMINSYMAGTITPLVYTSGNALGSVLITEASITGSLEAIT